MIPSKYANALYFTPRTPWGTRVQRRALRSHMQASETIPLPAPDEKHKLWGKELQGVGAGMATSKFAGSGGFTRTLDSVGVPRDLSSQITPQRASETNNHLAMFPASAPPTSQNSQSKPTTQPSVNPPSGGGSGGGYSPERAKSEPEERSDGLVGQHFYFGGTGDKNHGEPFSGDFGAGFKTDSSNYIQPATTKEALDDKWEKMYGPRADGIKEFHEFNRRKQ